MISGAEGPRLRMKRRGYTRGDQGVPGEGASRGRDRGRGRDRDRGRGRELLLQF